MAEIIEHETGKLVPSNAPLNASNVALAGTAGIGTYLATNEGARTAMVEAGKTVLEFIGKNPKAAAGLAAITVVGYGFKRITQKGTKLSFRDFKYSRD